MTRPDLEQRLARRFGNAPLTEADCDAEVRVILGAVAEALAASRRVEIRNFDSFSVHQRGARLGRNPKTCADVPVAPKTLPRFKARQARRRVDCN